MTAPAWAQMVATLQSRFGAKVATTDRDLIAPWLTDWRGRYHGAAPALLSPSSTHEVAAIVALAGELALPLVPQGGNTSMVGGATPPEDGSAAILSLRRLNRVRSVSPDANLAVAEAGVILADLHAAADAVGRRFPLTLGARGSATIGGLVSTNAGGTQVLRWGTMRALVAGVEAVLPDGSVHDGLTPLKKDNRGYDLNQLLIGAEGTLGVVTAATLRLAPAVADRAIAWVGLSDPHAALTLLRRLEAVTDTIESFELLPGRLLDLVVRHIPDARSPLAGVHAWHVLIEAVSSTADEEAPSRTLESLLGDALQDGVIADATIAASEAQGEAFWRLRDSLSEAQRSSGAVIAHDISVPVAAMPGFMLEVAPALEGRFPGARVMGFGHLGDGNIHFDALSPNGADRAAWMAANAGPITRFVNDAVVAAGGSISAEHGIGQMKIGELARLGPPSRLAGMTAIKRGLDPLGLFNPGKLVPLAPVGGQS